MPFAAIDFTEGGIFMNIGTISAFAIYFIAMIAVGIFFCKRSQNHADYILGGRSLNKWVAALSAQASDMSGWLLTGLPGLAFMSGCSEAFWTALGLLLGTYLNWKFVAKRLRQYTKVAGDSLTLPDFFENRFKDKTKQLRAVTAIIFIVFFLVYTAAQFAVGAKLFHTVFGWNYHVGLIVGAVIIVAYTMLGGFLAVCWTDFIQGMLMFFAIIIVPVFAMVKMGGMQASYDIISGFGAAYFNVMQAPEGQNIVMIIISSLAWGLGYFGMPHILVRFMGIKSPDEVKPARWVAMVWVTVSLIFAVLVGIFGKAYLTSAGAAITDGETVFMVMASKLFPVFIAGILLSAILAATMSTADSQLLVASSAISEDIYKAFFRKNASEKELMLVSRVTVLGVALIAVFMAMDPESSIFELVAHAWAGFGAAFGPAILFSLFWKKTNKTAVLVSILVGGAIALLWPYLPKTVTFGIYEIIPGFLASMLIIIIGSLAGKEPSKEILDEFEMVKNEKI